MVGASAQPHCAGTAMLVMSLGAMDHIVAPIAPVLKNVPGLRLPLLRQLSPFLRISYIVNPLSRLAANVINYFVPAGRRLSAAVGVDLSVLNG